MHKPIPDTWLDAWEQRAERISTTVPYILLAVSLILTALVGGGSEWSLLLDVALAGLAAAWMLWMDTLHPAWLARPRLMALYFAVLLALMAALVVRAPWFGFFTWSGFLIAFRILHNQWRFVGFAAVACIVATAQNGGLPRPTPVALFMYIGIVLITVVLSVGVLWVVSIGDQQSEQRKQALADLAAANAKLENMLAENAGLHAQLLAQAREAGVVDERQRMAREIHDTLAQGFTGIIAQLEAAKQGRHQPDQLLSHVEQAQTLARENLSEARRSVQALRPAALERAQLPDALAQLARRWSESATIVPRVEITGEPRALPAEAEVTLYRVAQEALTNVAKHARATRVGVTLSYLDDVVLLDVRDDGAGFDAEAVRSNGHDGEGYGVGLSAMRQRLSQVSGTLEIESGLGEGTAINASIPVSCAAVAPEPGARTEAGAGTGAGAGTRAGVEA